MQETLPRVDVATAPPQEGLPSPVAGYLQALHERHAANPAGAIATYIPELAKADPSWFGIALMTVDGTGYHVGDARRPFTIQSISKPLTYGLALDDLGETEVRRRIGVEPTGDAFNSIQLAPDSGAPLNPMVNAGAISAASLVLGGSASALDRIVDCYSGYAGRALTIDAAVFESERATGHRNRAIGHLLRASGVIDDDPESALDRYFAQCSVTVDCRDLATIAATLANSGVNPLTGVRVASERTVRAVLSVMSTCGMYDSAGDWLYTVGVPAKSGVSGGVLAVVPGQLGIGVFSPPVDARGNSVRGVAVCRDMSRDMELHLVGPIRPRVDPIRTRHPVSQIASKRLRSEHNRAVLAVLGDQGEVRELQGELTFLAAESATRGLSEASGQPRWCVLDVARASRVDDGAALLLADLARTLGAMGREVAISGGRRHHSAIDQIDAALQATGQPRIRTFLDADRAREWCEDQILAQARPEDSEAGPVALADHELLQGIDEAGVAVLNARLRRHSYVPGTLVVRRGDAADRLFLIVSGRLSVTIDLPDGTVRRLSTLSEGMVFGELTLIGREARTADVRADTMVECQVLEVDAFDRLIDEHPALACTVLANLLRIVGRTARRMTSEVALLAG